MKAALREGKKLELGALRLALAALKRQAIDTRTTLAEDAEFVALAVWVRTGLSNRAAHKGGAHSWPATASGVGALSR